MTEGTTVAQGPIACPSDNLASGNECEYADGFCVPQGSRRVEIGTAWVTETSPVNLCTDTFAQDGDLDRRRRIRTPVPPSDGFDCFAPPLGARFYPF